VTPKHRDCRTCLHDTDKECSAWAMYTRGGPADVWCIQYTGEDARTSPPGSPPCPEWTDQIPPTEPS